MGLLHKGDRICASCGGMKGKHRPGCIGDDTVEVISIFGRQQAIERYEEELRPYLANESRHDLTLNLWLDACFHS
jgi:hypothetical protein